MAVYLICYDINRLRDEVSRVLQEYGNRVQRSVFEVALRGEAEREGLRARLSEVLGETPELRFYRLCERCRATPGTSTGNRSRCSRARSSCDCQEARRHGRRHPARRAAGWRVALSIMGLAPDSHGEDQGRAAEHVISMGYGILPATERRSSARFAPQTLPPPKRGAMLRIRKGFPGTLPGRAQSLRLLKR